MRWNKNMFRQMLFPLVIALGLLSLAETFSSWQWTYRNGVRWFNFWWVGVATFSVSGISMAIIWIRQRRVPLIEFFWFMVPSIVSLFLIWEAGSVLTSKTHSDGGSIVIYAYYSCVFLVCIVIWIACFPFESLWQVQGKRVGSTWGIVLAITAIAISSVVIYQSRELTKGVATLSPPAIQSLQESLRNATVVIFVFLVLRILVPPIIFLASMAFKSNTEEST